MVCPLLRIETNLHQIEINKREGIQTQIIQDSSTTTQPLYLYIEKGAKVILKKNLGATHSIH